MARKISCEQAARLRVLIAVPRRWINRVVSRMNKLGFMPNDPLLVAAERVQTALQGFGSQVHYASCSHGVGVAEVLDDEARNWTQEVITGPADDALIAKVSAAIAASAAKGKRVRVRIYEI
jgi:hypothetical protein